VKQDSLRARRFRETTFLAPVGLVLTDLFEQMNINNLHALARDDSQDSYYDTSDLDLIRFGVILRFRSSTHRDFWNLQLFTKKGNRFIIHQDLDFDGHSLVIPTSLMDLLYAFHRSRTFVQIGQIRTAQRTYELHGVGGALHDEIIDNDISSSGALWEAKRFRKITVRGRVGSKAERGLLNSFESLVRVHRGCITSPAPEILRVLGSEATVPFAILESHPNSTERVYSIFQRAIAFSTLRLLRFDPGVRLSSDPEMVHEFRVEVRRLRSDLRSFSSVIEPTEAANLRSELSWLGGEVGKVRDGDVLIGHVRDLSFKCADNDESGFVILHSYLDDLGRRSRKALLEILNTKRYADLVNTTINIGTGAMSIESAPDATQHHLPARSSRNTIRKIVRRRWQKFVVSAQQINSGSSDLELHRVRILAKRCRYAAETALPLFGGPAKRFSSALAEVQDLLGKHHDCVFQEIWLRRIAKDLPEARVAIGKLILLMRQEREQLRSEWPAILEKTSSPKLRRWLRTSDK